MLYDKILADTAKKYPDAIALVFQGKSYTFQEIKDRVDTIAANLSPQLKRGDFAAIHLPNCLENLLVMFAYFKLGVTAVPIRSQLPLEHITHILKDAKPKLIVTNEELAANLDTAMAQSQSETTKYITSKSPVHGYHPFSDLEQTPVVNPIEASQASDEDIATVLYTSGSTGAPKGAMHQHKQWLWNVSIASRENFKPGDVTFMALNINHGYGLGEQLLAAWQAGATVLLESSFDAQRLLQAVTEGLEADDKTFQATYFLGVPSMYHAVASETRGNLVKGHQIRCLDYAGDMLPVNDQMLLTNSFGKVLRPSYGMTEAFAISDYSDYECGLEYPATIGQLREGVEIKILNPQTLKEVKPGEIGELYIKSPSVTIGYLNMEDGFPPGDIVDGYFRTGDAVRSVYGAGLVYESRLKRLIVNEHGYNVNPRDIEEQVCKHLDVSSSCVFDVTDAAAQKLIVALAVLNNDNPDSVSASTLFHLFDGLDKGHRPTVVKTQADEFKTGSTGKIDWQFYKQKYTQELQEPQVKSRDLYDARSTLASSH